MRWKKPNHNDKRTVVRFAFLPVETESCIVFLERYRVSQVYTNKFNDKGYITSRAWKDRNYYTYEVTIHDRNEKVS
jgi:hypothetical protein